MAIVSRNNRRTQELLPLTPGRVGVLNRARPSGKKHGYAVIEEVARRTDGAIRLSAGTLYTLIRRFVQEGVIAESASGPIPRWTTSGAATIG